MKKRILTILAIIGCIAVVFTSCKAEPKTVAVTGIEFESSEIIVQKGTNTELKLKVTPADASDKSVIWASSDETIAKVKEGILTSAAIGDADITAKTANGKTATLKVRVVDILSDGTKTLAELIAENELTEAVSLRIGGTLSNNNTDYQTLRKMTTLKSLDLGPVSNTIIPKQAFYDYDNPAKIENLILPEGTTKIQALAFALVPIKSIVLPDSVTAISASTFWGCNQLQSVHLSEQITNIPRACFQGCYSLTEINLHDNLTEIGRDAFYSCPLKITDGVFRIPKNVKIIGDSAFAYICDKDTVLNTIELNEGLEHIGVRAFDISKDNMSEKNKVTEIVLPTTLKELSDSSFNDTVDKWTFKSEIPPQLIRTYSPSNDQLEEAPTINKMINAEVYVPEGSIESYKTSVWGKGTNDKYHTDPYFAEANIKPIPTK